MAESIAVFFKSAKWNELKVTLDSIALPVEGKRWHFPSDTEPCVSIYPYDDLLNEYGDEAIDSLFTLLENFPASTLCIELRRSQGNRACDVATELVVTMLKQFDGIVDDLLFTCWTLAEITTFVTKNGQKFLDCYRVA
jgi:hypothetical protein